MKPHRRRSGVDIGAVPSDAGLEQKVEALLHRQTLLHSQFIDLRRSLTKAAIRTVVEEVYEADVNRLAKLRSDAMGLIELLLQKGMVSEDEIRTALK